MPGFKRHRTDLTMASMRAANIVWLTVGLLMTGRPAGAQPLELNVLHEFPGDEGGKDPTALIEATDGNLYGTTIVGGMSQQGILFRMSSQGTIAILHLFSSDEGINPIALVEGQNGL